MPAFAAAEELAAPGAAGVEDAEVAAAAVAAAEAAGGVGGWFFVFFHAACAFRSGSATSGNSPMSRPAMASATFRARARSFRRS